ncbi:hypothetical protein [uncultured Tateyamaria sp.]|uniref:hypothetical protein n=1 Tax=uncultured Tateyamaria sp. TaxID=455651 RepID=UPI0026037066|nr:hypothetical protein [uncultured Tateyamaria sp.]
MARKRYSDEGILRLLREVELSLSSCPDVASAYRTAGASDATYYIWRNGLVVPAATAARDAQIHPFR